MIITWFTGAAVLRLFHSYSDWLTKSRHPPGPIASNKHEPSYNKVGALFDYINKSILAPVYNYRT
jgi:hypothetical protein